MRTVVNPPWLTEMLERETFTHHSHYKVVRSNHKVHLITAMARLGGKQERIQKYLDVQNVIQGELNLDKLTQSQEIDFIKSDNLSDYRGKNVGFYAMKEKYEELLKTKYDGDMIAMIKDVVPDIIDGPLGSAFHSVISLGYGYVGNSRKAMLEGLLFMDLGFTPMIMNEPNHPKRKNLTRFGHGKIDIFEIFQKLHENKELCSLMETQNEDSLVERVQTHMVDVYGWAAPKYHGEYFLDLTDDIKFPEWFDTAKKDMSQLLKLIDWFCDKAVMIYVKSELQNEFFLLHGITASWSARQSLSLFEYQTALLGMRALIAGVLAAYVTEGAPKLMRCPEEFFEGEVTQDRWDILIEDTLRNDYEMHVYKVVQCCYEFWKDRKEHADYYFAAANSVRKYFYSFTNQRHVPNNEILDDTP